MIGGIFILILGQGGDRIAIKIEATGRTYKKNKQCEDLKKLYELYDGNNKKNHNERG